MRRPAAIGDEDRTPPRRFFRAAGILIEFPARQGCYGHFSLWTEASLRISI
jgi:hypothetical protein